MKVSEWTEEVRESMVVLCVEVAEDIGEPRPRSDFESMTDEELDKESDWYFEMSFK